MFADRFYALEAALPLSSASGTATRGAQGLGGSVDFIDDRDIRVAQFVASRFFGGIGCFEETLLNPTLAQQRRIAWFIAEQCGHVPACNLARRGKQRQCPTLPG